MAVVQAACWTRDLLSEVHSLVEFVVTFIRRGELGVPIASGVTLAPQTMGLVMIDLIPACCQVIQNAVPRRWTDENSILMVLLVVEFANGVWREFPAGDPSGNTDGSRRASSARSVFRGRYQPSKSEQQEIVLLQNGRTRLCRSLVNRCLKVTDDFAVPPVRATKSPATSQQRGSLGLMFHRRKFGYGAT